MAIATIDATVSGASANSYGTRVELIAFMELRPGGRAIISLDDEQQDAALLFAAILIDRESYWAFKTSSLQALQFPRGGDTVLPLKVKHAQFEQSLHLVDGGYLKQLEFIESQSQGVREISAEGTKVRMQPFHSDAFPAWRLAPQARQLLMGFIEAGIRVGRA